MALHPDDRPDNIEAFQLAIASGLPTEGLERSLRDAIRRHLPTRLDRALAATALASLALALFLSLSSAR
jgi:hypothetical protein